MINHLDGKFCSAAFKCFLIAFTISKIFRLKIIILFKTRACISKFSLFYFSEIDNADDDSNGLIDNFL